MIYKSFFRKHFLKYYNDKNQNQLQIVQPDRLKRVHCPLPTMSNSGVVRMLVPGPGPMFFGSESKTGLKGFFCVKIIISLSKKINLTKTCLIKIKLYFLYVR